MYVVLIRPRLAPRQAIAANAGHEVFTEGDAFAVAFHGPDDALGFALDVQVGVLPLASGQLAACEGVQRVLA